MNDILNSIKAQLYDRIVSPIFGAFFISWCVHNIMFIVLLFSKDSFSEKLKNVELMYEKGLSYNIPYLNVTFYFDYFYHWFLVPCLFSLAYLFIIPIPSSYFYKRQVLQKNELKTYRSNAENEIKLSVEQSLSLRENISNISEKYSKLIDEKDKNIADINSRLSEFQNDSIEKINLLIKEKDKIIEEKNNVINEKNNLVAENDKLSIRVNELTNSIGVYVAIAKSFNLIKNDIYPILLESIVDAIKVDRLVNKVPVGGYINELERSISLEKLVAYIYNNNKFDKFKTFFDVNSDNIAFLIIMSCTDNSNSNNIKLLNGDVVLL